MASFHGSIHGNGSDPPRSSMLAIHVRKSNGIPQLNEHSFGQLLEESLGQDENGESNLDSDVNVNYKLIHVVAEVGLDPLLLRANDDPFGVDCNSGKGRSQLAKCLGVLNLAILRSPDVIFKPATTDGKSRPVLLYVYLIPKILSVAGKSQATEISKNVFDILSTIVATGRSSSFLVSDTILSFLSFCLAGLVKHALTGGYQVDQDIALGDDEFCLGVPGNTQWCDTIAGQFRIRRLSELLAIASHLSVFLVRHTTGPKSVIARKQAAKLQNMMGSLQIENEKMSIIESLRAEIDSLCLLPAQIESFGILDSFEDWPDSGRARKRARISIQDDVEDEQEGRTRSVITYITRALTGQGVTDFDGLSATTALRFRTLSEDDQAVTLDALGRAACQLHILSTDSELFCSICDAMHTDLWSSHISHQIEELLKTLVALKPTIQRRSKLRYHAISALRRIVSHITTSDSLRLRGSVGGEWCLQSLRASSRDIKMVAAQALQAFVRTAPGRDTMFLHDNRIKALQYLQALWAEGDILTQEAVIVALTQVARVVGDEELNIILLSLIDYLGHQNVYISSVVYTEFQQLATNLQLSVYTLLRPFWRTLSVVLVKNFPKRPGLTQQICDLMGFQIESLLQIVEEHALPFLVLNKDQALINRIGSSSSTPMSPFEVCTKQDNLPRILSFLMSQQFSDPEQAIMDLLVHVSNDFREEDLAGWVNSDPIRIACHLLESIGDAGQGKASKTHHGLQLLAQLTHRRSGYSSMTRRTESMANFLENNALAIVTRFSQKLDEPPTREPNIEKRRCLVALGETVKLGKSRMKVALPQICACLRAAMDDKELCNSAFCAWATMMSSLGDDELTDLVGQTFAIILKYWNNLETRTQEHASNLVATLMENHKKLMHNLLPSLTSFGAIRCMSRFEAEIVALKTQKDERSQIVAFINRLNDENFTVVEQSLLELINFLRQKHDFIQKAVVREQPDSCIKDLTRAIFDAWTRFDSKPALTLIAGQCLGAIGCLDANKTESLRAKRAFVLISNFAKAEETTAFLMFFMEHVLVKEYVSTSNLREKGFLAWSLQQLLALCDLPSDITSRTRIGGLGLKDRQWFDLSETTRLILTPFLTSKFRSAGTRQKANITYPYFKPGMTYKQWLTEVTLDVLNRGSGDNVDIIFDVCCRLVVYGQGNSISSFLLPYAAVNLVLTGTEEDKRNLTTELSWVLEQSLAGLEIEQQEQLRQCSQSIFDILDYMSLWLQEMRKFLAQTKARVDRGIKDPSMERNLAQVDLIAPLIATVEPKVITQRAIECKSYARALFHQEQYMRLQSQPSDADYRRLQDIYAQIDEPDGIEGISAQMKLLDVESEVMEHKKAGRWSTAQSWYEMKLIEQPDDLDVQMNLLECLKESGQHDVLLHHFDGMVARSQTTPTTLIPFAVEASWVTSRWDKLSDYLSQAPKGEFHISLGQLMQHLREDDISEVNSKIAYLFGSATIELTPNKTSSFQSSHETLLKMHILEDIRILTTAGLDNKQDSLDATSKRLGIVGSYVSDKLYLLGIHRAIMHLMPHVFKDEDIATSWITSARLARKAKATSSAFNAVLRASSLGNSTASIEQAKLMWQEGHHRKAIQTLEGAIDSGAFESYALRTNITSATNTTEKREKAEQNAMMAKAFVLLGKWLDQAGQTQSEVIAKTFRKSTEQSRFYEKGWYNLGRHYNKILESEKLKTPGKESQPFLTGEISKLVIDNFLRALATGTKYMFQTLPKVLTLWLDLVSSATLEHDARRGNTQFHQQVAQQRVSIVKETNENVKKYLERIPLYALYTILPQLVARICHPDPAVNLILQLMIVKVVRAFPQQALWTVLATAKSSSKDRATRGLALLRKTVEKGASGIKGFSLAEVRDLITAGQKFSDELLRIADFTIETRMSKISLAREFGFNHKIAPSRLVVPCEACLIPNIPANINLNPKRDKEKDRENFRAFAQDPVTITAFLDDARVLPSLQKPRKLSLRGSDGNIYSVLAKPHDDLRKDQRLMEFNTMINRFLKRDIEASKRRLYIKTYAVIPLNEECGLIEWIDGLKTMRDILLELYAQRGIRAEYGVLRELLDQICTRSEDKPKDFAEKVQSRFPPILHQWFIETFPDPSTWFNARIRYTRSSAVMSMVGHVLGLGDRHGENILFEEGSGGILHVDFNCLFDKGLTFEKPECVPFRLTHNMIDAMGPHRYDGPFRHCCEIATTLLRNNEDGLLTILETFLYDPTTDFMTAGKKRKAATSAVMAGGFLVGDVPDTPERMLEGVRGKVRGMLPGESVPLSVGGYVEEMIKRASDGGNLARMYIGWCAFF